MIDFEGTLVHRRVIEGSLDNQRHRMQSFIDIKNMQEPGWGQLVEVFVDDGYSAKDTNRPAYQRMMRALKSGQINAVMVTELSRLSRNIPDFCDFHKVLERQGAKFLSIKEQFDTSTPSGKMMLYNMINLAQFEREQTSERVAINCHSRAQRGLLNGGPAILGYDKDPAKKTTFTVNETEAANVRRLFDLFIEHRTLARTIQALETEGIKPKARDNKRNRLVKAGRWTIDSLSFVLQNQAYIGIREINKANQHKEQESLKPWQRYGVAKASWPAIVEQKTFDLVQTIITENRERERLRLDTSESRVFAASGICVCEECGRRLVGQSAHGRNKVHRYYMHSSKKGDTITCKVKRIKAEKIEAKIAEHLTQILAETGHLDRIEERIKQSVAVSPEALKADKAKLSTELQKVTLAIRNTFKIQAALDADSDAIREVAKELEDLSRRKKHLESELENLKAKEFHTNDVEDAVFDLKARLEAFRKGWPMASAMMKKALLKEVIHSILVGPKGLKIQYRLKHNLNRNVTPEDLATAKSSQDNVIEMDTRRPSPPSGAAVCSDSHNLQISGSQVVGNGSERRT